MACLTKEEGILVGPVEGIVGWGFGWNRGGLSTSGKDIMEIKTA